MKKSSLPWPQMMLVCATLIWGSSFLIMKRAVDGIPVFYLLAVRFSLGAALLSVIFWKKWKLLNKKGLKAGFVLGAFMFAAYTFQTYGLSGLGPLEGTTPGKNAFLTATYCVLVPFLTWLLFRHKPDKYNILAAFFCIIGIGLVSLNADLSLTGGDLLTVLGGIAFSFHIVYVAHYAKTYDVILLTILQFLTMAILSWGGVLLTGEVPTQALSTPDLLRLGYLTVAATVLAMLFQNVGQAHTSPSTASVLMSLEAPFGVLFSVLFGDERPTFTMYCGFALIFFSVLLSETKLSFLPKKISK